MTAAKIDPHDSAAKFAQTFEKIKQTGIPGATDRENELILAYIDDMRQGVHAHSKKRLTPIRLLSIIFRLRAFYHLKAQYDPSITIEAMTPRQAIELFNGVRDGVYRGSSGKHLKDVESVINVTSAFHSWIRRTQAINGEEVLPAIFEFVNRKNQDKPAWTYLDFDEVRRLIEDMKFEYRVFFMFLFDSGVRAPTEALNVRMSDLEYDERTKSYTVEVRNEYSKTFGRRFKLLLSSDLLRRYVERERIGAGPDAAVFDVNPTKIIKYLRRHAIKTLLKTYASSEVDAIEDSDGSMRYVLKTDPAHEVSYLYGLFFDDMQTKGRGFISQISPYDFRHMSVCYWRPRYDGKKDSLLYRLGWKKSEMLDYYEEFLGMKDNIQDEDLLVDVTASQLERQLDHERKARQEETDELKLKMERMSEQIDLLKQLVAMTSDDLTERALQKVVSKRR